MLNITNYGNMQTTAYELIKQKILINEYLPGQKITEQLIAKDIQLGRTPVREALIHLKNDGLINVLPQNGTYIAKIDLKNAQNARFVRAQMEKKLVTEAVHLDRDNLVADLNQALDQQNNFRINNDVFGFLNADDQFHKALYDHADRAQIWNWLLTINFQLKRFRFLRLSITDLKWDNIINQHAQMIKLVSDGNIKAVIELIEQHLNLMLEEQKIVIKAFPDYFIKENPSYH